jgi:hypothetical protein
MKRIEENNHELSFKSHAFAWLYCGDFPQNQTDLRGEKIYRRQRTAAASFKKKLSKNFLKFS